MRAQLVGLFVLALALRFNNAVATFRPDGVVLAGTDPYLHLRRVQDILAGLPTPSVDPWVSWPDGARVDLPYGFDWLAAALLFVFGFDDADAALPVLAILPPVVGALTGVAFAAWCRPHFGERVAFLAACFLVLQGAHIDYTTVGAFDHHIVEPLLMLAVLWSTSRTGRGTWERAFVAGTVWAAATWIWPGCVVFGVTGLGVLVAQRERWRDVALAGGWAALVLLGLGAHYDWLAAGAFVHHSLSWLQPTLFAMLAGVAVLVGARGAVARTLALGVVLALSAVLVVASEPRVMGAYAFASGPYGVVSEARSPFVLGLLAVSWLGPFALLAPFWIVGILRRERQNGPLLQLALLALAWLPLALLQRRFGVTAALPLAGVAAWGLVRTRPNWPPLLRRPGAAAAPWTSRPNWPPLLRRPGAAAAPWTSRPNWVWLGVAVLAALPFVTLRPVVSPSMAWGRETLEWLHDGPVEADAAAPGVVAPWTWGHWISAISRRPVIATPQGQTEEHFAARKVVDDFYASPPDEAWRAAQALSVSYVLVERGAAVGALQDVLVRTSPARGPHFRHVFESKETLDGQPGVQLYQVVEGASIVGACMPDEDVTLRATLRTPPGRSVAVDGLTRCAPEGRFVFEIAEPTNGPAGSSLLADATVGCAHGRQSVIVSSMQVIEGAAVEVALHE